MNADDLYRRRSPLLRRACVAASTLLTALAAAPTLSAGPPAQPADSSMRVLFVGSSYTYYNNLPRLVAAVAEADDGSPRLETRTVAEAGACLEDHWNAGEVAAVLRAWEPDFVVLQPQSTFCRTFLVNGDFRVGDPAASMRQAGRLAATIRAAGAIPVLFAQWKRRSAPEWDQWAIDAAVGRTAHREEARVLPAGDAFQIASRRNPNLRLYDRDGSHPSPAGSLLAAETLYSVLTGRSPPSVRRVTGPPVREGDGRVLTDSTATLVGVDSAAAELLAGAAAEAVQAFPDAASSFPVVPAPVLPDVPTGRPIDTRGLGGTWTGPIWVYPYPGMLTIVADSTASGWNVSATIDFGGRPDDIEPSLTEVRRTATGLRFVDPDGPNGGAVRYEGVFTGAALQGVAEIVVPGGGIYAVGTWRVEKEDSGSQP